jgi:hypothetical protein
MEIANPRILISVKLATSPPKEILDRSKVFLPNSLIPVEFSSAKMSKSNPKSEHLDDIKVPCKVSEVQAGFLTVVTKDLNIMHCENGTNRRLFSHSP